MERKKDFFCWISVRPPRANAAEQLQPPADGQRGSDQKQDGSEEDRANRLSQVLEQILRLSRRGDISPTAVEAFLAVIKNGDRPPGVRQGDRPPGKYGGSRMSGWWQLDESFNGRPMIVGFEPIVGSRDDAITWFESEDGRAFQQGAVSTFLMSFSAVGND